MSYRRSVSPYAKEALSREGASFRFTSQTTLLEREAQTLPYSLYQHLIRVILERLKERLPNR
jgi:hypothetical protein